MKILFFGFKDRENAQYYFEKYFTNIDTFIYEADVFVTNDSLIEYDLFVAPQKRQRLDHDILAILAKKNNSLFIVPMEPRLYG